jgi:hypothetical protein
LDDNFASKFANDVSAVGAHNVDHQNVDWSGGMGADLNDFSQEIYACKLKTKQKTLVQVHISTFKNMRR